MFQDSVQLKLEQTPRSVGDITGPDNESELLT